MIKITYSGEYHKTERAEINSEELADLVDRKITLFSKNPDDTRLKSHALKKKMKGKLAFSITDDIRIIYKWTGKSSVRFLTIGSHSKVYN